MLESLTQRLSAVVKNLRGQARLTEDNIQDALREVRMALLEADVALPVVKEFVGRVKEKALGQEVMGNLTPGQALVGVVHQELAHLMGERNDAINLAAVPPAVLLMAGLQGSGKTTTSGKLARLLKEQLKKKVLLVSCDIYRPAAIDQLATLGKQLDIDFYPPAPELAPVAIAEQAVDHARRHFFDVVIVDTAGRLTIDAEMMQEIRDLHGAISPVETFLVVDAMQGQDAVNTARAFADALPLTGLVLTKLDGDARGGAALSVCHVTGKPVKFVGVGEKLTGLEPFHPDRMASRILGMGDVLTLIEDAQRKVDRDEAERLTKKFKAGKGFDLEDFKGQINQMRKMGGVGAFLDKLPGQFSQVANQASVDDRAFNRIEGIINAMTRQERAKPEILKASRKRRIAAGAGVTVQEVNRLLNQFEQAQKMMKMVQKGGMAKLMRGMKGMLPGMH
jgi:signal recognition particle subunit SRP54